MGKKTHGFEVKTKKIGTETPVLLPQTPEEFDQFCTAIIERFNLPNTEQTRCSIGEMICHLPKFEDTKPLSFFAAGVRRGIAHLVAYNKVEEIYKPIREAQKKKEEEEKTAKLSLVENGTSSENEQPLQNA